MRTFMLNSLQESKILTYAPKMTDIWGFQGVYLGAWGQVYNLIVKCPGIFCHVPISK